MSPLKMTAWEANVEQHNAKIQILPPLSVLLLNVFNVIQEFRQ